KKRPPRLRAEAESFPVEVLLRGRGGGGSGGRRLVLLLGLLGLLGLVGGLLVGLVSLVSGLLLGLLVRLRRLVGGGSGGRRGGRGGLRERDARQREQGNGDQKLLHLDLLGDVHQLVFKEGATLSAS